MAHIVIIWLKFTNPMRKKKCQLFDTILWSKIKTNHFIVEETVCGKQLADDVFALLKAHTQFVCVRGCAHIAHK